uniref:Aldo_ket_red domain-containing protein n=1 Tax=Heterorhabditis bacteriophora TaxID=37862 RepID=A0A1I7X288_HETBA
MVLGFIVATSFLQNIYSSHVVEFTMQSHTFSRTRGVPVCMNGSVSHYKLHDPQNSFPPTFVACFHDETAVRRMQYRRLENTEMVVSKMAFGSAPIGGMFGNVEDSITKIVETAIRGGINFIDTAYWYGQTRSESILGKVGRFELDYARTFDFRADKILESLTNSLKRLKLTYIDVCFVQIHDADFAPNESIILYETLQALEMAKHSGKIRYIGLTGYPLKKLAIHNFLNVFHLEVRILFSALQRKYPFLNWLWITLLTCLDAIAVLWVWTACNRYLDRLENAGWEGVDVAQYWKRLKKLGLTALATHRHSSVESLASTLNGLSLYSSPSSSELRTPKKIKRQS